jgi:hypothetical protein
VAVLAEWLAFFSSTLLLAETPVCVYNSVWVGVSLDLVLVCVLTSFLNSAILTPNLRILTPNLGIFARAQLCYSMEQTLPLWY